MRSVIHDFVERDPDTNALLSWATTDDGKRVLAEYESLHRDVYPDLMAEVEGLAVGSMLPFRTLLIVNLANELVWHANITRAAARGRGGHKGCSDYHIATESTAAWGHTEDGEPAFINNTYMVRSRVTINGTAPTGYTAFVYAGALAGWAWGVNDNGLALSINALTVPVDVSKAGLGVTFVARSVLGASSIHDAVTRAQISGQASGQHFNLGVAAVVGSSGESPSMQLSIETSPRGEM